MKMSLRLAGEPTPPPAGPILLATGFRPFFLAAGLYGAVGIPLWLLLFAGRLGVAPSLPPSWWHAHEMLVGFAGAVIAGFLLTAVRMWAGGRPTAANGPLAALVVLWVIGRLAHAPGVSVGSWAVVPDVLWLLGLTVAIGRPLIAARSKRNYGFLVALPALAACSAILPLWPEKAPLALQVALAIVVSVLVVVSGRIVPLFTRNALPALGVDGSPRAERAVPAAIGAIVLAAALPPGWVRAALLILAAMVLVARMARWRSLGTAREPLLWILHVGCWWIPVGLLASAAGALGWLPTSVGTHALSAGAIGALVIGMLARVSLGHTGRPLRAPPTATASFVAIVAAGLARAAAPLLGNPTWLLTASGALWSLALVLWLVAVGPFLLRPRPDGKPG